MQMLSQNEENRYIKIQNVMGLVSLKYGNEMENAVVNNQRFFWVSLI